MITWQYRLCNRRREGRTRETSRVLRAFALAAWIVMSKLSFVSGTCIKHNYLVTISITQYLSTFGISQVKDTNTVGLRHFYYKMFCLRLGMNHHSYQQIYNIHTWCIYNSNQRDTFLHGSLKWAKTVKYRKKTSEIFRTLTKTSNPPHPFPNFKFIKFYFSSRLDEDMASFMDCILCLILNPTLFCRCLKNSFNSFSRFSL